MKLIIRNQIIQVCLFLFVLGCAESDVEHDSESNHSKVSINAIDYTASEGEVSQSNGQIMHKDGKSWLAFDVMIKEAGRYKIEVDAKGEGVFWIEDYYDNKDGRTYDITGKMSLSAGNEVPVKIGSPMNEGLHKIKLHVSGKNVTINELRFDLIKPHKNSPVTFTQAMDGKEWGLIWSDEFEGSEVDTTKWTYDIGNWGWGNSELQYYTVGRKENARVENGHLIIEALKDDLDYPWTSARLTTRGKESFLYGKIEFRAKVPAEKGNWAAGWTLGDAYVDELSWPYCGEIDILESVGYEVNEDGRGIAHVTVHTPAYYFKINNQISNTKEIKDITNSFHTYSVEWTPSEIRGYVDGELYYRYDKNANEMEWPFDKPQNIVLNLAIGGGWGGAMGIDSTMTSQKFTIDYVRVYELK